MTQQVALPSSGLAWRLPGKGMRLVLEEVPVRLPGPGEALVKIEACGLCGSDRLLQAGGFGEDKLPVVPGHEAAGTVVAVGGNDSANQGLIGQRVALYYIDRDEEFFAWSGRENLGPNLTRMGVDVDGALSQYVTRPADSLVPGRGLSAPELAVLSDAVATPFHALELANPQAGHTVAVIGTGGVGSNAVQLAALRGSRTIAIGRSASKLSVAAALGATKTITSDKGAEEIVSHAGGHIDCVIQCVGSSELDRLALEIAGIGGSVVFVGASNDRFSATSLEFIQRELKVMGSRGFTRQDIADVISLRVDRKITLDHLLSDVRSFREAGDAFEHIGSNGVLRTIIEPWAEIYDDTTLAKKERT